MTSVRSTRRKQHTAHALLAHISDEVLRYATATLVVAFAVVTVQTVITWANGDDANLLNARIVPILNEDGSRLTIPVRSEFRFTSMGVWQTPDREETFEEPVAAEWRLIDGGGSIDGCANQKRCTFVAGETPGTYRIEITVRPTNGGTYSTVAWFDTTATEEEETARPFFDDVPSWALPAAIRLNALGIMRGYDVRSGEDRPRFGASDSVTRAQMTTLITRLLRHLDLVLDDVRCEAYFDDVPAGHFGCDAMTLFADQGWIEHNAERLFRPDESAPRGVTAVLIANALGETIEHAEGFERNDLPQVFDDVPMGYPSFTHIALINRAGFMTGQAAAEGERPDFGLGNLNRAEIAVLMARMLDWFDARNIGQLRGYDPNARLEGDHGAAPEGEEEQRREQTGAVCTFNGQCESGNCVDSVCCNTACRGMCQACNLGGSMGACTAIADRQDPANECSGATSCNGSGGCSRSRQEGAVECQQWGGPWNRCDIRYGNGECEEGFCEITHCYPGWRDADGRVDNGCEKEFDLPGEIECNGHWVDPQTDDAHCGGCNASCTGAEMCSQGSCVERVYSECYVANSWDPTSTNRDPALVGNLFAKRQFTARTRCTNAIMEELMNEYCAYGNNATVTAQWIQKDYSFPGTGTSPVGYADDRHSCP